PSRSRLGSNGIEIGVNGDANAIYAIAGAIRLVKEGLRTVVAVDGDVLLGEVAGQDAVPAAAETDRHLELDLRVLHRLRDLGLVVRGMARALVRAADAAEPDRELIAVGGLAGLADRHYHAAPIGILAGDRGFHQRRIGNRHGNAPRGLFRHRAFDLDLD